MIRAVWGAFHQEQATGEDVCGVLHQVAGILQFELATLSAQVERGISQPEDPIFRQITQAFQSHLEAVEAMLTAFEQEDSAGFEAGMQSAQDANNALMEAHRQAMEQIEAMANVDCIFCRAENPRGEERCRNCGRNLPGAVEKSSFAAENAEGLERGGPQGAEVTENYVLLAGAVQEWRREEIDADQLMEALQAVEQRTRAHQADLVQQRDQIGLAPAEAREALHQGVDMTESALCDSLAALEKMKLAFVKGDDTYLETGLHDLEKASRALVAAYHAAREAAAATR